MVKKIAFGLLWLGFVIYAFGFAPPDHPDTFEMIKNLCIGQWQGINPLVTALFYLMGIWPMIYSALLLIDGRGQKIPAWPFVAASFGVGIFAVLPYLALRQPHPRFFGQKHILLKLLDSRGYGILLTVATVILIAYGVTAGDWINFGQQWQTNRFIHVMSLDFCLLSLLFPTLLKDDMAHRGWENQQYFWLFAAFPLFGALIYLCVRPPLTEESSD